MKRRNKVLALLLALCMTLGVLLCCPFAASAADNYAEGYYLSNVEHNLYIRSSSRSDSQSVGVLPKGTIIDVVECIPNDNWGRIVFNGVSGWVRLDLCKSLQNVSLYVVRIPEDATTENTDFAAIRTDKVKGDVDGAMICLGRVNRENAEPYTLNKNFAALAAAARKAGLVVGAYFISDAASADEGKAQGAFVASALDAANETLKLPVSIFYPAGTMTAEANPAVGEAVSAFAAEIRAKGFYPGVYCDKALSAAAAKDAGRSTYAFWFNDVVSDTLTDATVTMWEYRLQMKEEDRKNYYAGNYPMTLCIFDYPTLLSYGCVNGQHKTGEEWIVEKAATCMEKGREVRICTVCRAVVEVRELDALGHTPVITEAVSPTCTMDGQAAGTICSVCNEVLYRPNVLPATGHKWNDGEETVNDIGETIKLYTCTKCGMALQAESRFAAGDISMDGIVTAEDARLALRAAVGLANYLAGGVEFAIADTNDDKAITAEDARSILRAAVGLEALGTVTYRLPDGKVTDRTKPETSEDPLNEKTFTTALLAEKLSLRLVADSKETVNAGTAVAAGILSTASADIDDDGKNELIAVTMKAENDKNICELVCADVDDQGEIKTAAIALPEVVVTAGVNLLSTASEVYITDNKVYVKSDYRSGVQGSGSSSGFVYALCEYDGSEWICSVSYRSGIAQGTIFATNYLTNETVRSEGADATAVNTFVSALEAQTKAAADLADAAHLICKTAWTVEDSSFNASFEKTGALEARITY